MAGLNTIIDMFSRKGGSKTVNPLNTSWIMEKMEISGGDEKALKPLPVIGNLPARMQMAVLQLGTLVAALLFLATVLLAFQASSQTAANRIMAKDLEMLSLRLPQSMAKATGGSTEGFEALESAFGRFGSNLETLENRSGFLTGKPDELGEIHKTWSDSFTPGQNKPSVATILAQREVLVAMGMQITQINAGDAAFGALVKEVAGRNPAAAQLPQIGALMVRHANDALSFDTAKPGWTAPLVASIDLFDKTAANLNGGDKARLTEAFKPYAQLKDIVVRNTAALESVRLTSIAITRDSETLLEKSSRLAAGYGEGIISYVFLVLSVIEAVALLGFLYLLVRVFNQEAVRRRMQSEAENRRNQDAILRLLNDMADLADGDLTVRAAVTEDLTGAIADSINFTIDELRSLITEINRATEQVTRATGQAHQISSDLYTAAERQSHEIVETNQAVSQIVRSIQGVTTSATESSKVAHASLSAAEQGAEAVNNQIKGMNEIREQIQETAKRIKRLGESSQEIGEIVELISDITEQTNVLALNAAIQAAAAGEAGRGFSVVAEEVQRLAERSAEATKQIGAIVKTIQADTHDAVAAMELSTQGVVEGAKLSDAAGSALAEIGRVSRELARLIESIAHETEDQTQLAARVNAAMRDILAVTEQTTTGTKQTAEVVAQMTALASELKSSVAGFKLA
ncbi:twitching motility protein PilJ [Formivibrio citricus]|uniref:Twitching motility protein PilJ n=1 Tax=Formivibrio citricus TaxID=83765 RepID=A0A1I4WZH0_9NEIS|nr:methyl-accepting chemotaxis protein [Formivibrio citricus]SFN19258.1 twitching motility protein PilJ [Formivibrio citricus]